MLNKKQLDSIGYENEEQIPKNLWNPQIDKYYEQYQSDREEDQGQNNQIKRNDYDSDGFKDFISMSLQGANRYGTGRRTFKSVKNIQFVLVAKQCPELTKNDQKNLSKKDFKNIKKADKQSQKRMMINNLSADSKSLNKTKAAWQPSPEAIRSIQQILSSFFQIPARHNTSIQLNVKLKPKTKGKLLIIDKKNSLQLQVKQKQSMFDALDLLNLGLEYNTKSQSTILLFLIEADMMQAGIQIDGRACGDGVAFTTFKREDFECMSMSQKERNPLIKRKGKKKVQNYPSYMITVLVHECFHTLGFDHCSAWKCLMNTVTNNEFWLCPCCSRKIQSELVKSPKVKNGAQWHKDLVLTLQNIQKRLQAQGLSWMKQQIQSFLKKGEAILEKIQN